jgi:hypothetical protein
MFVGMGKISVPEAPGDHKKNMSSCQAIDFLGF